MKVLSLFDGISCGMVALQRAGIKVDKYIAYEIDENAIKVSKANYPEIEQKGDVFKAEYKDGEFDLLIGGSPCTYWSIAKAGYGRETTSSGIGFQLFMQYVRALQEAKPKWFLYENNDSISQDIKNEITKQLGVVPVMIDSADFSAQTRKRCYWTNIPIEQWERSNIVFKDIVDNETQMPVANFEKYKGTVKTSKDGMCVSWDTSGKGNYSQQNRARKPKQKWNTLTASGTDKNNLYLGGTKYRKLTPRERERLQTLPDDYTVCLKSQALRSKAIGNGWTVDVIAYILKGLKHG